MIEHNAMKSHWLGVAFGIGLVAAVMGPGCEAHDGGAGLAPDQRTQLRALGIERVESSGDLHTLYDARGVEVATVELDGMQADVVLGSQSATLSRGTLAASIACDGMDPRVVDRAGDLAAFIDGSELSAECTRALHLGRIISTFDTGHAPGCEVETVDDQPRLFCDQQPDSVVFRNLGGPDDCICDDIGWGWCPPECWSCGAGTCDPFPGDIGGGPGGGDIGGPACWFFDRTYDGTHAVDELLYEDPMSLCPGAQANAEQACLESLVIDCTPEVGSATVIDADCESGKSGYSCWCTVRVECSYY